MLRQTLLFLSLSAVGILGLPVSSWTCCWWTTSSSPGQPAQLTQMSSFSQELKFEPGPQQFEAHVQSFRDSFPINPAPVARQGRVSSSSHKSEFQYVSNRTSSGVTSDGMVVKNGAHRRVSGKKYSYQSSRQVRVLPAPEEPEHLPIPPIPTSYWTEVRCRISRC